MMRRRDQVRLSLQKLGLRKKRAAFAIVSVALGTIVLVTVSSLVSGVREMAMKTSLTEEIDADVIRVKLDNPNQFFVSEEERQAKAKKRIQFLTEAELEKIRQWPEVEAADKVVMVQPISVDAWTKRPRPVWMLEGAPEPLLRRYARNAGTWAAGSNAIPLVVGERNVRLHLDPTKKKLALSTTGDAAAWIGREVTLTVGDNGAQIDRFQLNYEKHEFRVLTDDELATQRSTNQRNLASQYDMTIFNTTLSLKGRIVGLCPGKQVLLPQATAVLCEKWLDQRRRLAELRPRRVSEEAEFNSRGRSTARSDEFSEALVLVKPGIAIETIAKRIDQLGFYAETRARKLESFTKEFDSGLRVVKIIIFAFGGVILGLALALVWSTTSKVVSDSRADIGLFRALGATKQDIRRLFLSESVWLGLLGTAVGILLGWSLAAAISHWVMTFAGHTIFDPEEALLLPPTIFAIDAMFCFELLAGTAFVSFLAGLWPANRAADIDPVKALKLE